MSNRSSVQLKLTQHCMSAVTEDAESNEIQLHPHWDGQRSHTQQPVSVRVWNPCAAGVKDAGATKPVWRVPAIPLLAVDPRT